MLRQPRASGPLRSRAVVEYGPCILCERGKVDPWTRGVRRELVVRGVGHMASAVVRLMVWSWTIWRRPVKQNANRGIIRVFTDPCPFSLHARVFDGTQTTALGRGAQRTEHARETGVTSSKQQPLHSASSIRGSAPSVESILTKLDSIRDPYESHLTAAGQISLRPT